MQIQQIHRRHWRLSDRNEASLLLLSNRSAEPDDRIDFGEFSSKFIAITLCHTSGDDKPRAVSTSLIELKNDLD